MPSQTGPNILIMDVHGVFFTAESADNRGTALIGTGRHQKWVDAVRSALLEAGALQLQVKEGLLDPCVLWKLRMSIELTTPKTMRSGRVVPERKFHERVNLRLLRKVAPGFIRGLTRKQRKQLAHRVKEIRRNAPRYGYFLESDMRELADELVQEVMWACYFTTANLQSATQLFRSENVPVTLFAKLFAPEAVKLPKSHPAFWAKIAAAIKTSPGRCVVVEDNLTMGVNAVRAGMSVVFLDRYYGIEEFIRDELQGEVAGVRLYHIGERIARDGKQFVVCAKTPAGVRMCLRRVIRAREENDQ